MEANIKTLFRSCTPLPLVEPRLNSEDFSMKHHRVLYHLVCIFYRMYCIQMHINYFHCLFSVFSDIYHIKSLYIIFNLNKKSISAKACLLSYWNTLEVLQCQWRLIFNKVIAPYCIDKFWCPLLNPGLKDVVSTLILCQRALLRFLHCPIYYIKSTRKKKQQKFQSQTASTTLKWHCKTQTPQDGRNVVLVRMRFHVKVWCTK